MIKEYKAVGFTEQSDNGEWCASLLHKKGCLETWGHETRTEAERMVQYLGGKLGLKRTGEWRRS